MDKEKIRGIISRMTIHQKVLLCTGKNSWRTRDFEELGIPSVLVSDGTSGVRFQYGSDQPQEMSFYDSLGGSFDNEQALARTCEATCFPSGSAIACSFDTELVGRIGKALAEECRALDINMLLGPGMNIHRHPLTARNFEYYSEDPVLTGEMGSAMVKGVQRLGVGTCMKHFACHNSDSRRTRVNVTVSERALREIYLAGYERVVKKADPVSFMTAYNRVNGEEMSGDNRITRDIVRNEWKYDKALICDWGAVKDPVEASKGTIDLQMPLSKSSAMYLEEAVKSGELDESLLDARVEHILNLVFTLKEWEKEWHTGSDQGCADPGSVQNAGTGFSWADHHRLAVEAASESIVLLKNGGGILPLNPKEGGRIAVIGHLAIDPLFKGTGCAAVHAKQVDIPLEEMKKTCKGRELVFCEGYLPDGSRSEKFLEEAVRAAEEADQAVIFVGSFMPGEDDDFNRKDIRLLPAMAELIEKVSAVNSHCIVVLSSGEVCEMPWRDRVDGLLYTWFTGEGMGQALSDILFGKISPSGRLASTVPERLQDTPAYLSFDGNTYELPYAEDIYVGYRYYEKKGIRPAYPFGFGLSYSSFEYNNLVVQTINDHQKEFPTTVSYVSLPAPASEKRNPPEPLAGQRRQCGQHCLIHASVDVLNIGSRKAKHAVQLYIEPAMKTRLPRPVRELKAFTKVELEPGEKKTVTFDLDRRDFSYYDPEVKNWVVENGVYKVEICSDAMTPVLSRDLEWTGETDYRLLRPDCGFHELFEHPEIKEMFYEFLVEKGLVRKDQVDEKLEKGIVWSFWPVRNFLDMNADGKIPFEDFDAFLEKANRKLEAMRSKAADSCNSER